MKIIIIDDNKTDREITTQMCTEYVQQKKLCCDVQALSGYDEQILKNVGESDSGDVLILDIEMPEKTGIDIRREMEDEARNIFVIYVTNHPEIMPAAFGRNVIAFLEKPLREEVFFDALDTTVRYCFAGAKLEIKNGIYVNSQDIRCIVASHVYTSVNVGNEIYETRDSLNTWEKRLPMEDFLRISPGCIVGCRWIDSFEKGKVIMKGNLGRFSVGRRREQECRNQYREYKKKMARYL